ncbi:MAG: hypothetical protein WC096_00590 [Sphaerochaetaceae bacterium]
MASKTKKPIPPPGFTSERAKVCGKRGGIASGISKRKKKAMLEDLAVIMEMTPKGKPPAKLSTLRSLSAVNKSNLSLYQRGLVQIAKSWAAGDPKTIDLVMKYSLSTTQTIKGEVTVTDDKKLKSIKEKLLKDPELVNELLGDTDDEC